MTGRLDGTVALVTGASSGIGEATALELAAQGAAVVLVARRKERLGEAATRIEAAGGRALIVPADITDAAQAAGSVDAAAEWLGRLDIVVNNAGLMLTGPAEEAPLEEWDRMIDINARGLLHVTHAALPHLLAAAEDEPRRVADIVNISSVAGRIARPGMGVYNLTKFGVVAFSESLRQEVTGRHVRVAAVEPGWVTTELTEHIRPGAREQILQRFAGIEPLRPEDVADAIVYTVTRPRHVAVNEILVRPTEQSF